jgi:opacity protein-like surface antigen
VRALRFSLLTLLLGLAGLAGATVKHQQVSYHNPYPFYVGVSGGYGTTDWGMVTANEYDSAGFTNPVALSMPINAKDKGLTYGFIVGYQPSPMFAIEANYTRFPTSKLTFTPYSYYWPDADEYITIPSSTYTYGLSGKFIVPVKGTDHFKAFASAGLSVVSRHDILASTQRVGAVFGVGTSYKITSHWSSEFGFQYYTGYGRSSILPAQDYIPFAYKAYLSVLYHFTV